MSKDYDIRDWKDVVEEIDDTPLRFNDISDVMDEVRDLAHQWEHIARNLGIWYSDIETIRALIDAKMNAKSAKRDAERALSDAIYYWIDRDNFGRPNWKTLANAVQPINDALARTIARNHPQVTTLKLTKEDQFTIRKKLKHLSDSDVKKLGKALQLQSHALEMQLQSLTLADSPLDINVLLESIIKDNCTWDHLIEALKKIGRDSEAERINFLYTGKKKYGHLGPFPEEFKSAYGKTLGLESSSDNIGAVIIVTNTYSGKGYIQSPRQDGVKLSEAFKALKNFDVYWKENVNRTEMTKYIKEVGKLESKFLKNYRCIIFIFSGHGSDDYVVMQDNSTFPIFEDIIEPLLPENAPGIKTIPKVFLFDACRGDHRTEVKHEVKSSSIIEKSLLAKLGENDTVAKQGNIMVAYATLPGHRSYGVSQDGGYWLSTLADLLNKDDWYKNSLEILLTEVSRVMQKSIGDNQKFLQPVRVSLLNQHICLNLKPDFGNKNSAGLSS